MVTGDEHDLLSMASPAQDLLHHGILHRRPLDTAPHGPEVDDVAHQEQMLAFIFAQDIQQLIRLAATGA